MGAVGPARTGARRRGCPRGPAGQAGVVASGMAGMRSRAGEESRGQITKDLTGGVEKLRFG